MSKACPGCGAVALPEARFCRLCGAPLKAGGGVGESEPAVSPKAQTAPLKNDGRSTDGLPADDPQRGATDTSRVGRAEMEEILRRVEADYRQGGEARQEPQPARTGAAQTAALSAEPGTDARPAVAATPAASAAQPVQPPAGAGSKRLWTFAAVALLCVALVAGVLAFVLSRRANSTDTSASAQPISISDQQQLLDEKLAEAEPLLEAGEFNHAIEVLRAAVKIDPKSVEAHMRLGNALERTGARNEAIAEYRAAVESDPNNISALRALASAQAEEKLYNDAAESYRRLLAASGNNFDDETWLAYGDALRLAGRKEEARAVYQKIVTSESAQLGQAAREHLAELGPPPVVVSTEHPRETRAANEPPAPRETEIVTAPPAPLPMTMPTPTPRADIPTATTVGNSASRVDYDAYYFQAVNIVNGRDPKKVERAELLHALALFQRAALGGTHQAEAQRYADRLGKEYDRRRKL